MRGPIGQGTLHGAIFTVTLGQRQPHVLSLETSQTFNLRSAPCLWWLQGGTWHRLDLWARRRLFHDYTISNILEKQWLLRDTLCSNLQNSGKRHIYHVHRLCRGCLRSRATCNTCSDEDRNQTFERLEYRWDQIYSLVHAVAFVCHPFYSQFQKNVAATLRYSSVDLHAQAHKAIQLLYRNDKNDRANVMVEFMAFSATEAQFLLLVNGIIKYHPRLIWDQVIPNQEYCRCSIRWTNNGDTW